VPVQPSPEAPPRRRPTLTEHLDPKTGPKRILALDGGGVRGILTLQYLAAIEALLRRRRGDPSYVLADYFDLIGGTSTGAIIAAALAVGYEVKKLDTLYRDLAARIFKKPFLRLGAIVPKFGDKALRAALQHAYGADTRFASPGLRTGLMVMTKRMDTGSPWPLTNHPDDPYFSPQLGKQRIGNGNMLLWQVVRASTAAPHFFRPEDLQVGSALDPASGKPIVVNGQFVDGGVSTANNPALQLLKVALLGGFSFHWQTGADKLLMVSVGTGLASRKHGRARGFSAMAGAFAARALVSIMDDCNDEVETVMQWLSRSPTARRIDGQVKDLGADLLAGRELLTYQRYNVLLESGWVKDELGRDLAQDRLNELAKMDAPGNMDALADLGAAHAAQALREGHFPPCFDPA
jgi:hypothetical protein